MRRRERNVELFSLTFPDVIACGFGAIVLLLLISRSGVTEAPGARRDRHPAQADLPASGSGVLMAPAAGWP